MPLDTETFDIEATLGEKREERNQLADEVATLDPDNPAFAEKSKRGNMLDTHVEALEWALDAWDVDEITLAGLTGGEYARLENELEQDGNGSGDIRIATIVHGTDEAPYLCDDDAQTYAAVGQLPVAVQKWLEYEINEMTSVGNSDETFAKLVAERRRQADGTDD